MMLWPPIEIHSAVPSSLLIIFMFVSSCGITLSLDCEFTTENKNYNSLIWREFVIIFYHWKKKNSFERKKIINLLCEFIIEFILSEWERNLFESSLFFNI